MLYDTTMRRKRKRERERVCVRACVCVRGGGRHTAVVGVVEAVAALGGVVMQADHHHVHHVDAKGQLRERTPEAHACSPWPIHTFTHSQPPTAAAAAAAAAASSGRRKKKKILSPGAPYFDSAQSVYPSPFPNQE